MTWAAEYCRLALLLAQERAARADHEPALELLDRAGRELQQHPAEQTRPQRRHLALNRGRIWTQMGEHEKALAAWDEALGLGEAQDWLRLYRALALAQLGRCEEAAELAAAWRDSGVPAGLDLAGCIFAQCSAWWLGDGEAARGAVVAGQYALEAARCFLGAMRGGVRPSLPPEVIRDDAAFQLIRKHPEYQALLAELGEAGRGEA